MHELTGRRFGFLTAIERADKKGGRTAWICLCDCGNKHIVTTKELLRGTTRSCGCLRRKVLSETSKTHGESKTRLYRIWADIKTRCFNKKSRNYYKYGGRGISMCREWLEYEPFKSWAVSNGYDDRLSIDRIDVNGDYEPSNCRWADNVTQANNTRRNVYLEHDGEIKTMAEWARYFGCTYSLLHNRHRKGYSKGDIFYGLKKV